MVDDDMMMYTTYALSFNLGGEKKSEVRATSTNLTDKILVSLGETTFLSGTETQRSADKGKIPNSGKLCQYPLYITEVEHIPTTFHSGPQNMKNLTLGLSFLLGLAEVVDVAQFSPR